MMPELNEPIELEAFYFYGFHGLTMVAVRAPFAMPDNARELVGRTGTAQGRLFRIIDIKRQISGPVAAGEPIGVEIADVYLDNAAT